MTPQLSSLADYNLPGRGFDADHETRLAQRYAQPFPLADREPFDAGVPADHLAGRSHDLARRIRIPSTGTHKLVVPAGSDEADLLAIFLVRHAQPQLSCQLANFRLAVAAHGQQHSLK